MSTFVSAARSAVRALGLWCALCTLPPTALALTSSDSTNSANIFPLFRNHPLIREHASSLPAPYGISANYFIQNQHIAIANLHFDQLAVEPARPLALPTSASALILAGVNPADHGENRLQQYGLRFDVWLLPILNLFYMPGRGHGRAILDGELAGSALPDFARLNYALDSETLGATLAAGYRRWWASVTAARTQAKGDSAENLKFSLHSSLLSPRIGFKASTKWTLWVGANRLKLHRLSGHIRGLSWLTTVQALPTSVVPTLINLLSDVPPTAPESLAINFSADIRIPRRWSYFGGVAYQLSPRWSVQTELGGDALDSWQLLSELQIRLP